MHICWRSHRHNISWHYVIIGILFPEFKWQCCSNDSHLCCYDSTQRNTPEIPTCQGQLCRCVCVLLYSVFVIYGCYVRKVLVRLWAIISAHYFITLFMPIPMSCQETRFQVRNQNHFVGSCVVSGLSVCGLRIICYHMLAFEVWVLGWRSG